MTGRRIVFAGPSLSRADIARHDTLDFLPPVARDDVLRAIDDRPEAIGIVDGHFGDRPAVLHKEILEAMAEGIEVYGAASMGALRACELHSFGMIGVGRIFRAYLNGDLTSDAAVAVAHGPAELGFPLLSVAQVDVAATARALVAREHLAPEEARALVRTSAAIFYADRTWRGIAEACAGPREAASLEALLSSSHVEAKRLDAIELLRTMERAPPTVARGTKAFRPPRTPSFRRRLAAVGR
jgi:hypothetical protein